MSEPHNDDYIDPRFEQPWIKKGSSMEENIRLEREEIVKVRGVIENFVGEMAKRRKNWKAEYERLKEEFGNGHQPPSILSPFRRKRFRRYKSLGRILGDLPQRETYATRDVHRKTHGCLAATFKVRDDLEADLAKGLFRPGARYDAVIRFSNGNPKGLPDLEPDARGMAVKLLPEGTLPHDNNPEAVVKQWVSDYKEQQIDPVEINRQGQLDIVTINFPVFFMNEPPRYAEVNKAFLDITDDEDCLLERKWSELKAIFFRVKDKWQRELALNVNGSIIFNPLYQKYYSMAPSRLGGKDDETRTAVKYMWEPCRGAKYDELLKTNNPPWADLHEYAHPVLGQIEKRRRGVPKELKQDRNYLRTMVARSLDSRRFEQQRTMPPVCFELKVQKYIDDVQTPIEDTTMIWLESEEQRAQWASKHKIPADEKRAVKSRQITPARTIGTLVISPLPPAEIEPQNGSGVPQTRNHRHCEDLSFNPWNNVPEEHKPLGIVQRMKREVYAGSRNTRFKENRVTNVFIQK
jgi:hypothetical protein